jgi:YD repeat-containing protein
VVSFSPPILSIEHPSSVRLRCAEWHCMHEGIPMSLTRSSRARDSRSLRWSGTLGAWLLGFITAASAGITYEYDNAGRLRKVTYDDGMVVTYGLDAAGNRTTVTKAQAGGSVQFTAATFSVGEGTSTVTITASRTGGSTGAVGISYATSNGTATAGSDYTAASGTLSWTNGDSANKSFTVTIINDSAVESSETINLALSSPTGGAALGSPATAVLTITDNDVAVPGSIQLSSSSYSVTEGTATVTITATRTGGTSGAVGISYATSNGTATAGSDYTAASGTLSWSNGDAASKTFTVSITNDTAVESSETVNITLSSPTGSATLGSPSTAVLTIADNDAPPVGAVQFSASSYSVGEGGTSVTITATRTGGSNGAIGVSYATSSGTATAGSDYTTASGTLSWANADTASKTFTVSISEDSSVEGSETVNLTLSSPTGGATLGSPASAVLTITDNDNPPAGSIQFTASTASVAENGTSITITASRSGGSFGAIGASYATANGTAVAGSDYTAASGTLSWTNGETANKTFSVTIADDSLHEVSETFTATLSAPTGGGSIGSPASITVSINDNDAGPVFSIANVSPAETAGSVTLTVTKSGSTSLTHAVSYASANGSAAAGADYTAVSSSLSFGPSDTSLTFTVPILDDSIYEQNETFSVALSGATNGASVSGGAGTATVTINDNDAGPAFSIGNVSVNESATSASFTVTKSGSTALTHTVSYATSNGTAAAGSDYTAASGTLTFTSGVTLQPITITLTPDAMFEGNETFNVVLSSPGNGATVSSGTGVATIVDDDPNVTITISDMLVAAEGFGFSVQYYLNPSGDILATNASGTNVDVGDWLSPKSGMGNYEVRATLNVAQGGESFCQGPIGTWVDLSTTGAAWQTFVPGADSYRFCDINLQIRAKANPSVILDTANVRIEQFAGT